MTEAQLEHFRIEHQKLEEKYNKLLKFVKDINDRSACKCCESSNEAYYVLKEIGEIE